MAVCDRSWDSLINATITFSALIPITFENNLFLLCVIIQSAFDICTIVDSSDKSLLFDLIRSSVGVIGFQCFITTFIIEWISPMLSLFISSLSPRARKFTEWRSIARVGETLFLSLSLSLSITGIEFLVLTADRRSVASCVLSSSPKSFLKVEQRAARKRIARNKPARRFPLPAIWICRKGSLLFIFWGPMEGEIVCVRGGRLRALILRGPNVTHGTSPRENFARRPYVYR